MNTRVRFAPSPTGPLHIGGVRTALYNYLFARKMGGTMVLRIEDTDQARFVSNAEAYIMEALRWVGIEIDEGVEQGGPYAPYRQSERKKIYRQYAEQLVATGYAYYAFDTPEELDAMRERLRGAGVDMPQYNAISRVQMTNSLTLPADQVQQRLTAGQAYTIRLNVPPKEDIRFRDLVRGWVAVHSSQIDDKVLMKSDGMPTYHLANVVDDYLMKITHVIRGEEWLPSAPLHILLYRYLGWEAAMPAFAHLPLLLKPEGNGKLSKRDADLGGFPVFPLEWTDTVTQNTALGFREEGYLPETMVNFLAFLGWNPGGEQEFFLMKDLIEVFSLDNIHKAGARFDIQKAKWFNHHYLKEQSSEDLAKKYVLPALALLGKEISEDNAIKMVHLMKDRITFPQEIVNETMYLFEAPQEYDTDVMATKWNTEIANVLQVYSQKLRIIQDFDAHIAKELLGTIAQENSIKMGKIMQPLRVAITGLSAGPDLMLIMEILGKDEIARRIDTRCAI